ncbi:MAG: hypothetical protein EXR72_02970 [Myxococcales bacterium]|nr:hypothetical protein [Myxococcales bacterium]
MNDRTLIASWVATAVALATVGLFVGEGLTVGVFAAGTLVVGSIFLCRRLDPDRAMNLAGIFALAVAVRWGVAAGVHLLVYKDQPGLFAPDEVGYEYECRSLVAWLSGRIPAIPPDAYSPGIVWVMAVCYWLLGPGPLSAKLFTATAGSWCAVMAALIALRAYPPKVARRVGLFAAIFPSLVLWSSLQLKDAWTLFGVELALLTFMHLRERFRLSLLLLFGLSLIPVGANRPYEVVFIALGVGASFLFSSGRHFLRNFGLFIIITVLLTVVIRQIGALSLGYEGLDLSTMERFNGIRSGYADATSAINTDLVDPTTSTGLLLSLPIGLVYFFLAPFPFTGTSTISLATSPEMLLWYALLPSLYRGFQRMRKEKRSVILLPVLFYTLASSLGWSMVVTNVGSLYRYRAQILFLPLILISADQLHRIEAALRQRIAAARNLRAGLPVPSTLVRQ